MKEYLVKKSVDSLGCVHKIYKFPNGYGASVVSGCYTYGGKQGLWELAVIRWIGDEDWYLCYTTPITNDVLGWLTDDQVKQTLLKIRDLPKINGKNEMEVQKVTNFEYMKSKGIDYIDAGFDLNAELTDETKDFIDLAADFFQCVFNTDSSSETESPADRASN